MRRLPLYPIMVFALVSIGGYLGCKPEEAKELLGDVLKDAADAGLSNKFVTNPTTPPTGSNENTWPQSGNPLPNGPVQIPASTTMPQRTQHTLLIGSFNIQRLGPSKLKSDLKMQRLAAIIRQFDVIGIQEITSKDQQTVPRLLRYVNQSGASYSYTISQRVGRAHLGYYEQYAYIYDTRRVKSGQEYSYMVNDDADLLHREPWVSRFQTYASAGQQPFSFLLINVHTDPDEIRKELDVLANVYQSVRQYEVNEDDVILLGDLNAAPGKLQNLERIPGVIPVIRNTTTNTIRKKALDNILLDQARTVEFTGRAGVLDMQNMFQISTDDAKQLSDHQPIWAEFSILERREVAAVNSPVRR